MTIRAIILFILFSLFSRAEKITPDSLFNELRDAKHDTLRIKAALKIADFHKNSIPDSSLPYINIAKQLSKKTGNGKWDGYIYRLSGYFEFQKGNYKETLLNYNKSLAIFRDQKDHFNVGKLIYLTGVAHVYLGDYKKGLNNFFEAREIFEKNNFENDAADATIGIANIYGRLNNPEKEFEFNYKALKIKEKINDKYGMASVFLNLGKASSKLGKQDQAIEFTLKSIKISEELNNAKWLISGYGNLGSIYSLKKDYKNGLKYFLKCIEFAEKINDVAHLGTVYGNVGQLYSELKMQKEAYSYYQKALQLSKVTGDMEQLKDNHYAFYEYYITIKDYKNAITHLKTYMSIKDSLLSGSTADQLNELQTKYETDKKEKEIEILNKDKEIQKNQIAQQIIINYSIILGLMIVLVFSFLLFNRLKVTRQQKNLIELQKTDVEQKNLIIEEKQKEILDSIHYAKRIQSTLLAHQDFVNQNLPENFIYFNPKDIVSGDFYWATKKDNKFFLAVCDSTGHGVPGAFMSLLNINFLNEAINEKNITKPNLVFNYVRERLTKSISKDGQQDGFDGILICFNYTDNTIEYTAANNAPVLVSGNQLIELPADKMPVGIGERKEDFKLYSITPKQNDIIYLYTDGYADQFGGPKGKKFKYKQLDELLISISNSPIKDQHDALRLRFEDWKGTLEQVDDVCVIGIRF